MAPLLSLNIDPNRTEYAELVYPVMFSYSASNRTDSVPEIIF